jgi:hypothetical protein
MRISVGIVSWGGRSGSIEGGDDIEGAEARLKLPVYKPFYLNHARHRTSFQELLESVFLVVDARTRTTDHSVQTICRPRQVSHFHGNLCTAYSSPVSSLLILYVHFFTSSPLIPSTVTLGSLIDPQSLSRACFLVVISLPCIGRDTGGDTLSLLSVIPVLPLDSNTGEIEVLGGKLLDRTAHRRNRHRGTVNSQTGNICKRTVLVMLKRNLNIKAAVPK